MHTLSSIPPKHYLALVALLGLIVGVSNSALAQESANSSLTKAHTVNQHSIKLFAVNGASQYTRKAEDTPHTNIANNDGNHPPHWYVSGASKDDANTTVAFPVSIWHLH